MKAIEFDAIVFKEGNNFVAYCPELDISSCGKDLEEARKNIKEAVQFFLEEAGNMGTLSEILEEAGYKGDEKNGYTPPQIIATEVMAVNLESV